MGVNERNKDISELLEKNFSNINTWLHFAEAKNAANLAFVVACISIIDMDDINVISCIIISILIVSGIISMISFWSKVGSIWISDHNNHSAYNNLILFSYIEKYDGREYLRKVYEKYFQNIEFEEDAYELDLANEIVYNAHITSCKYRCFNIAAVLDIIALVLFIILFIIA